MGDEGSRLSQQEQKTTVRLVEVDESGDGQRIDNFLIRVLKGVPRTHIYRLLRTGEVRVNKGRARPGRRLATGDVVRLPPLRQGERSAPKISPNTKINLIKTIVYEDKSMYIFNKPSGLAVHGGSGVSYGVIEALRQARPLERELELAHRLDRDTSGCLMVARRRSALRRLQALQRDGRVVKLYQALLAGRIKESRFTVDAPLQKNRLAGGERVVRVDDSGQTAVTHFMVLKRYPDATLVQVRLETGRTHQIRVHAAHIGHPIIGDEKYGDRSANRLGRRFGLKRLFLHAVELRLPAADGETARGLRVTAPLPDELQHVLAKMATR